MLGLGKWRFYIDFFLYKGYVYLNIEDNNGKYKITPEADGYTGDIVYDLDDVVVKGNTLHVEISSVAIPGNKRISGDLIFDGDKCKAVAEVPFVGHLELKDGIRVG